MPDDLRPPRRAAASNTKQRPALEERHVVARDGHELFVRAWRPAEQKGPPLVLTDGLGCQGYAWTHITDAFRDERAVIMWHYRGHGASRAPDDLDVLTVERMVHDLEDVLCALDVDEAVFLGYSMGVQVVLEAVRAWPERVRGLVLLNGTYERPLDTWHNPPSRYAKPTTSNRVMKRLFPLLASAFLYYPEHAHRVWRSVIPTKLAYHVATRFEVNGARIDPRDFLPYLAHIGNMDMRVFVQLAGALAVHSAADVLPTVRAPTLIVSGRRDSFAPVWLSEEMHRLIEESELLIVTDGTHATPVEHPQLINLRLEKFLRERVDGAR